jgi:L-threonylcarbamoyladenylate synthase
MPNRLTLKPHQRHDDIVAAAVAALQAGSIVAYPTDTLYGLAVDPRHRAAVLDLFDVKGRDRSQAMPLIAADASQAEVLAREWTPLAARLARHGWPGPLTLVVRASRDLPAELLGGRDTVAVRVPDASLARSLAWGIGHPITSTSANRSGHPAARTADVVIRELGGAIAVVIDAGPSNLVVPSTIVDVTGEVPVLVRAGAVSWERVLDFSTA